MPPKTSVPKVNVLALAQQAHSLCEPLERGQANKPLTDALLRLSDSGEKPLVLSVLCLDSAVHQAMDEHARRMAPQSQNLVWRIAECQELLDDISAYQQFCRGAHALVVAGSQRLTLEARQLEVIRSTSELFPLVWPAVVVAGEQTESGDDAAAWWQSVRSAVMAASVDPSSYCSDGGLCADWQQPLQALREPLMLSRRSAELSGLLEKLAVRIEHEVAYLTLAQSRLEVPAKSTLARASADSDKELIPLRERLAEQSATIDRQLSLKSDRSTQPLGELTGMMRNVCNSIQIEDLDVSRSSAMFKLGINASHLARINRRIEHVLRQEFVNDLRQVERQMRSASDDLLSSIRARVGTEVVLPMPELDVNHAWRAVENLMAIGKETHIELVRKGIFDVLTAGRQKVFIIIMFASLMGRMGLPNLFSTPGTKAAFGIFMAVVMVASMVNAIFHWRRERQVTTEKELGKIRDSLLAEGSKVIEQVERAKLTAMREFLKEASRVFECTARQSIDEALAEQRLRKEFEIQKQEAIRKALEQRWKQVVEMQRGVGRLIEQARHLCTAAHQSLHDVLSRTPVGNQASISAVAEKTAEVTAVDAALQNAARPTAPSERVARTTARLTTTALSPSERPRATSGLAERRQRRELALGKPKDQ